MRKPKPPKTPKTNRAARAKPGALSRHLDRAALLDGLKKFRGRLPKDFKFDRDKANER